ncbi:phenylalanine--tRNA ligase subunit beta, partial [Bacteriovoracaceae bacterium]|nr:phenylalanine--tRNA ligase subunit beta [Bacteriovoracaceae bacterium]
MKISFNWLKDFTDLPELPADDIANRFTMACAEVEDIITVGDELKKVVIAQITAIKPHPDANKLNLVTFIYNEKKDTKEVVCGAPNVKVGLKVPFAPIGTTLPNGLTLEPRKIRGILSDGMLCSEVELGLGFGKAGLLELPEEAPIGKSLQEYYDISSDVVLEIDNKSLTHRPDLWGHYGIAREFAAIFDNSLKNPFDQNWISSLEKKFGESSASPIKIKVDKDSAGLAYFGLSIDKVKIGPTPSWMKNRLEAVGLRSINNIVDISNYVMLELGVPLHIFDREKIMGSTISIEQVKDKTTFTTLDEQKRELIPGDTIICDEKEPLVLAGIMGGLNSSVSESTTKIFIEVANWKAHEIRLTSTRLGLRTDSSSRYEKSLDSTLCYRTLLRTASYILDLCSEAVVIGSVEYDGVDLSLIKDKEMQVDYNFIRETLGKDVDDKKISSILASLDIKVCPLKESVFNLIIPTYRVTKDIEYPQDIVEEIGRVIGYDNIVDTPPMAAVHPSRLSQPLKTRRMIQDFLTQHAQCLEVFTYPLVGEELLKNINWTELNKDLVLVNALSQTADRMRPTLIGSAIEVASLNTKNFSSFKFFEHGRVYKTKSGKDFNREVNQVLIGYYQSNNTPFIELNNTVEDLCGNLGLPFSLEEKNEKFPSEIVDYKWDGLHPFEFMNIKIMGKNKGSIFSLHPLLLKKFKIKGHLSLAIIELEG